MILDGNESLDHLGIFPAGLAFQPNNSDIRKRALPKACRQRRIELPTTAASYARRSHREGTMPWRHQRDTKSDININIESKSKSESEIKSKSKSRSSKSKPNSNIKSTIKSNDGTPARHRH